MKFIFGIYIIILFLFLLPNYSSAEEKVNLKDEAVAKEILLNKGWRCSLGDSMYSGYSIWTFKTIEGNKVSGTIEREYCGSERAVDGDGATMGTTFKGKLKKNTLKYSVPDQGIRCTRFSGKLNFFTLDGTDVQAKGKYTRYSHGSETFRGTIICYVQ